MTPELPLHRGGFRQRALHAVDREHPSENPKTGKNVALSVNRDAAQDARAARGQDLRLLAFRYHAPLA